MSSDYARYCGHVNTRYNVHLLFCARAISQGMDIGWRSRLLAAVDNDGRSDRAISQAAGLGVNAVNEIRNTGKEPSVERVLKLADELNLSLAYLFLGYEVTRREELFLETMTRLPETAKDQFVQFLEMLQSGVGGSKPALGSQAEVPAKSGKPDIL